MIRPILLVLTGAATLACAGCATAPKPLRGEFAAIQPAQASAQQAAGSSVRWGGRIIEIEPGPDQTCFVVLGTELRGDSRPTLRDDASAGRFIACRGGFYDPALFEVDRELTVTGRVSGFIERPIGDYTYSYPLVEAEVIYLWPERRPMAVYHDPFFAGPFWPYHRPYHWGGSYRYYHRAPAKQADGNSGGEVQSRRSE